MISMKTDQIEYYYCESVKSAREECSGKIRGIFKVIPSELRTLFIYLEGIPEHKKDKDGWVESWFKVVVTTNNSMHSGFKIKKISTKKAERLLFLHAI